MKDTIVCFRISRNLRAALEEISRAERRGLFRRPSRTSFTCTWGKGEKGRPVKRSAATPGEESPYVL